MSVRIMSLVFENTKLSSTEKLVMLALADHANDEGKSVYPSQQTLSRKTGLARATVNKHISELVDKGYLRRVRYMEERSNILELAIMLRPLHMGGVTENDTLLGEGVTENDRGVSSRMTGGVTEDDTNHHLTIIKNHQLTKGGTGDLFDDCLNVYKSMKGETLPGHKYVDMIKVFEEKGVTAEDYRQAIVEQDATGRYQGANAPHSYMTFAVGIADARNNPVQPRPNTRQPAKTNLELLEEMHANGTL
jgi:hypothetical protein